MKTYPRTWTILLSAITAAGLLMPSVPSVAKTKYVTRTVTTTRFVRTGFSLQGRVMHDTNLIRRSLILMGDDGIRRRIDVRKGIPVFDDRTGKRLSVHELHNGDRIRISGFQTDVKRWEANRIDMMAKG
jgi:hypothetical protein